MSEKANWQDCGKFFVATIDGHEFTVFSRAWGQWWYRRDHTYRPYGPFKSPEQAQEEAEKSLERTEE